MTTALGPIDHSLRDRANLVVPDSKTVTRRGEF